MDDTINVTSSRIMYDAMRKYGNVTYTEYSAEAHPSWNSAYSPELDDDGDGLNNLDDLIDWMFNQSRNGTLDGSVDTDPLAGVIWDVQQQEEADYSESRWTQLQAESQRAEKLLDEGDEEQLKESIWLMDALMNDGAAEQTGVEWTLNRAMLRAQRMLECESMSDTAYAALDEVMTKAAQATEEKAMIQAYVQMEKAMQDAGDTRDQMELQRLSEDLSQLDLSGYADDAAKDLQDALAQAQDVLQDEQASSSAIESAYANVLDALQGLTETSEGDAGQNVDDADTAVAIPFAQISGMLLTSAGALFALRRKK